jgi:transcriptional regulator with XRE-family HTH domain
MITDIAKIGPRLRQLRTEAGLTQAEVAQSCGLHQNTMSVFEKNGEGSLASLFTLLSFYQKKLSPKKFDFLADTFAISEEPVTALTNIAAERLEEFRVDAIAQLEEIIAQLKGTGIQQL